MEKVEAVALKPCPFCDSPAVLDDDDCFPSCSNLGCEALGPASICDGRESWNKRPAEDASQLEIGRLREALKRAVLWGGLGKSYDASVAFDLLQWIEAGATGDLPPLPEYHSAMKEAGDD